MEPLNNYELSELVKKLQDRNFELVKSNEQVCAMLVASQLKNLELQKALEKEIEHNKSDDL